MTFEVWSEKSHGIKFTEGIAVKVVGELQTQL